MGGTIYEEFTVPAETTPSRMTTTRTRKAVEGPITEILRACRRGDDDAFQRLLEVTYNDLRRIAHRQLRRAHPGMTVQTTGLIHEVYLKLAGHVQLDWRDRSHFYAISATAMRQIIIDHAKKKSTLKHGGHITHFELDEGRLGISRQAELLLTLDAALHRLAAFDPRLIQVVECRYFAGYSERETAQALGVSLRTVQRDWMRAKAWLREEIDPEHSNRRL